MVTWEYGKMSILKITTDRFLHSRTRAIQVFNWLMPGVKQARGSWLGGKQIQREKNWQTVAPSAISFIKLIFLQLL
jgi:hypothetical protein